MLITRMDALSEKLMQDSFQPGQKLYTKKIDEAKESRKNTCKCFFDFLIIKENTTPAEFKAAWNEKRALEKRGINSCCYINGLGCAVGIMNLEMTKFFIKKINLKIIDSSICGGTRALYRAVHWRVAKQVAKQDDEKCLEIVNQLLMAGADPNLAFEELRDDKFNESYLTKALGSSDVKLTKLLLEFGAQKQYAIADDGKSLIKQKFTDEENKIYKKAKEAPTIKNLKDEKKKLFFLGSKDPNSLVHYLPKEIMEQILTCDPRIVSSNQHRINEAKKWIAAAKY